MRYAFGDMPSEICPRRYAPRYNYITVHSKIICSYSHDSS